MTSPQPPRNCSRHGYRLLQGARTEPWTQVTARLLTAEGLLIAVCRTPWLHADVPDDHGVDTTGVRVL